MKKILVALAFLIFLSGCATTFLPSTRTTQTLPWKDFDKAYAAYLKVQPNVTTMEELKGLGFDLNKVSNSEEWNQMRTRQYLLGFGIRPEDVLGSDKDCRVQIFPVDFSEIRGAGNVVMELSGFETKRQTVGSKLRALFFYRAEDGMVVYKLLDRQPLINEIQITKDPLGPFKKMYPTLLPLVLAWLMSTLNNN